jgi:hypothetical protein
MGQSNCAGLTGKVIVIHLPMFAISPHSISLLGADLIGVGLTNPARVDPVSIST